MHTPPAHRSAGTRPSGLSRRLSIATLLTSLAAWLGLCSPARSGPPGALADPTRPPGVAAAALATGSANRPGQRGSAKPDNAGAQPATPSVALASVVLQGIQTSSRNPPWAMVDGQLVKLGDSVAGRTVLAIDNQGLLLRGPSGHERLWLLTDSPKQAAGSITTTRSAAYLPAARGADSAADADGVQRADRSGSPNIPSPTNTPSAGNAAALSLVGRTTP